MYKVFKEIKLLKNKFKCCMLMFIKYCVKDSRSILGGRLRGCIMLFLRYDRVVFIMNL